jgi:Holliday junction resolvasome RuvABC endonuclease subunit
MKLMAIDPSSVAVGWALFDDGRLMKTNVIRSSGEFIPRMQFLMECVRDLVVIHGAHTIAIEMHDGLPFARNNRKADEKRSPKVAATLCHAQGMILATLLLVCPNVKMIGDQTWTNREPKGERAAKIHAAYPEFMSVWATDSGMDAADAVGIGLHWQTLALLEKLADTPGAKALGVNIKRANDGQ